MVGPYQVYQPVPVSISQPMAQRVVTSMGMSLPLTSAPLVPAYAPYHQYAAGPPRPTQVSSNPAYCVATTNVESTLHGSNYDTNGGFNGDASC